MFNLKNTKMNLKTFFYNLNSNFLLMITSVKKGTIIIYGLFFLISIGLLTTYSKEVLHLSVNKIHSPFFDFFFKHSTHLGDGILFGILIIVFFFIDKRMSLVFTIGGLLTLIITHFLKKCIFKGEPRPVSFFGEENLYLIDGVKMAHWNSFPSGHTMTAFIIFTILIIYFRKKRIQYLLILLAIIAGFSRVYLSQHFWADIFVGSIIGVGLGFFVMSLFFKPK